MRFLQNRLVFLFGLPLMTSICIGQKPTISNLGSTGTSDTKYTVKVGGLAAAATVSIKTSDEAALLSTTSLNVPAGGTASFVVQFETTGAQTITVTNPAAPAMPAVQPITITTSSQSAILNCGSCYASLGAGVALSSTKFGDYNNSANILESTQLGNSTPQFVVGLAYKLPFQGLGYHKLLNCTQDSFYNPSSEGQAAFCYPFKAFVSLKFSPDASQTFNGFTYGMSHAIHKRLDVMFGVSYSAHNEISPGFKAAAINTVTIQKAANNPYYAQWNLADLTSNGPTAFDGFPTQLLNSDGTTGALIYTGTPLILHYHPAFFIGISVPLSFKSALSGGN